MKLLTKVWQRKISKSSTMALDEAPSAVKWTCRGCARGGHCVSTDPQGPAKSTAAHQLLRSMVASKGASAIAWDKGPRVLPVLLQSGFSAAISFLSSHSPSPTSESCPRAINAFQLGAWVFSKPGSGLHRSAFSSLEMEGRETWGQGAASGSFLEPVWWASPLTTVALEGSKTEEGTGGPRAAGSTIRRNLPLKMYNFSVSI